MAREMTAKIIACLAATLLLLTSCSETGGPPSTPAPPAAEKKAPSQDKPATTTEPTTVAGDPSEVAMENQGAGDERYGERYRVLVDLDGDSQDDLILSQDTRSFGKAGGTWAVFLRRGSNFLNIGEIFAHQAMIAFEVDHARNSTEESRVYTRIWVYHHLSGSEGGISYFLVGPKSVSEGGGSLLLYTGDGGTEMGNGVADAIFKHSEIPFRVEVSKTDDKGKITWQKYERY
jgi:hypothetical protein